MTEEPIRLQGPQQAIRAAYFAHDSGLFTLDCVPGAGKSVVATHVAAETLLRRYVAGDRTPEQAVGLLTFTRAEAASFVPAIRDRLRTIVTHDLVPVATEVTAEDVDLLCNRLGQAPCLGTVDGFLRSVFENIAPHIGFGQAPTVGNEARLEAVHAACFEQVRTDPDRQDAVATLQAGYPDSEYDAGPERLVRDALTYCRDHQCSTAAFRAELEATLEAVYPTGRPQSFVDVFAGVAWAIGTDDAAVLREAIPPDEPCVCEPETDQNEGDHALASQDIVGHETRRECLAAADQALYDDWQACIDAFCRVLAAYRAAYRAETRTRGVVSHTDVAFLVAGFFAGDLPRSGDLTKSGTRPESDVAEARERMRARYQLRLDSLILDEAQDISAIQHAALAQLITPEMRVLACGDPQQSIYGWRHADPEQFATAASEGQFLGIDWDPHETRTAARTYRFGSEIASAVDAVAGPALTDSARGDLGTLESGYPGLDADPSSQSPTTGGDERPRTEADEPRVHVASFAGHGYPGSSQWVAPADGQGEADRLAAYLASGLADGTFTDDTGEPLAITVLFRRRTRMPAYEQAFAAAGLRVCNASDHLFESPAVRTVFAVCRWLTAPTAPERLGELVNDSPAPLDCLSTVIDPTADQPFDVDEDSLSGAQRALLDGLDRLRTRRDACLLRPAAASIEEIIDAIGLRADPHDLLPETEPRQRVANLDALVELVAQWEGDQHFDPAQLVRVAAPFLDTPRDGPTQPATDRGAHDVIFRTVHDAKGDESDVVALADLGFDIWMQGPRTQRLLTRGRETGLAPPVTAPDVELPVSALTGNLYTPDTGYKRDVGLRWGTEHWADEVCGGERDHLLGPPRLAATAGQARAESWRVLFVALTRAREHLVVPLPRRLADDAPRDRWLDTICAGLQYEGQRSTYTLAAGERWPGAESVQVAVDAPDPLADRPANGDLPAPDVAQMPRRSREPWVPRTVAPSTLYPLTEHPDEHVLGHLLNEALHTETHAVSGDLPFDFEQVGPETVGSCLHSVVARLVSQDIATGVIRTMAEPVPRLINQAVRAHAPAASGATHRAIRQFFVQHVRGPLLQSDLWALKQEATQVAVEQPVAGEVHVDGYRISVRGTADFVFDLPSGAQHVVDVKIALAEPTPAIRRRYEVQLGAYLSVLAGQPSAPEAVRGTLETFGVTRSTVTPSDFSDSVTTRIQTLLGHRSV